jgi:hypothetical protein
MTHPVGFTAPSPQVIIQPPIQENEKLIDHKAHILTELAAIEQGISLFDFLDPARDQLQSSVASVPCQVKLLSGSRRFPPKPLSVGECGTVLAEIIIEMGKSPSTTPVQIPRGTPKCEAILNHAHVFFAQLKDSRDARMGLQTAVGLIPHRGPQAKPPTPNPPPEDDQTGTKRVHPFFPDVHGIEPLLGHMKEQLGEFPNFVRNPPDDAQCEELRFAAEPDWMRTHLLEICGSSSDDEFDPDAALDTTHSTTYSHPIPPKPI